MTAIIDGKQIAPRLTSRRWMKVDGRPHLLLYDADDLYGR